MATNTTSTTTTRFFNNANDILPLTVDVSSEDKADQMKNIAKQLCPFLAGEVLSVKPLSGGLSNELFVATTAAGCSGEATTTTEQQPQYSVLVRIHPSQSTDNNGNEVLSIVDREVENSICAWLSSQQIGPLYYGRFQNGRIEEFYPNHFPLSHRDMSVVGPTHIAPIMAQFHALKVPQHVLVPLATPTTDKDTYRGDIFERVRTWITMAEEATKQQTADHFKGNNEKASVLLIKCKEHWNWLEEALHTTEQQQQEPAQEAARTFLREIVFTHMDMQSLNFLRPPTDTTNTATNSSSSNNIKVIDFEYAGFNPRAIDIANTFCEHCDMNNMKADYEHEYPSDQVQNDFLQTYIHSTLQQVAPSEQHALLSSYVDDPTFLTAARQEIGRYTLVSHMGWAIWSIVQSSMSEIEFDYVAYARHRLDGFDHMKKRYF